MKRTLILTVLVLLLCPSLAFAVCDVSADTTFPSSVTITGSDCTWENAEITINGDLYLPATAVLAVGGCDVTVTGSVYIDETDSVSPIRLSLGGANLTVGGSFSVSESGASAETYVFMDESALDVGGKITVYEGAALAVFSTTGTTSITADGAVGDPNAIDNYGFLYVECEDSDVEFHIGADKRLGIRAGGQIDTQPDTTCDITFSGVGSTGTWRGIAALERGASMNLQSSRADEDYNPRNVSIANIDADYPAITFTGGTSEQEPLLKVEGINFVQTSHNGAAIYVHDLSDNTNTEHYFEAIRILSNSISGYKTPILFENIHMMTRAYVMYNEITSLQPTYTAYGEALIKFTNVKASNDIWINENVLSGVADFECGILVEDSYIASGESCDIIGNQINSASGEEDSCGVRVSALDSFDLDAICALEISYNVIETGTDGIFVTGGLESPNCAENGDDAGRVGLSDIIISYNELTDPGDNGNAVGITLTDFDAAYTNAVHSVAHNEATGYEYAMVIEDHNVGKVDSTPRLSVYENYLYFGSVGLTYQTLLLLDNTSEARVLYNYFGNNGANANWYHIYGISNTNLTCDGSHFYQAPHTENVYGVTCTNNVYL